MRRRGLDARHISRSRGLADGLEVSYLGKGYFGEFTAERSRRIHGKHQRHPGRIARPVLVAADGAKLICDVQWPNAGRPAGVCKDNTGASLDVRFE
jgi:hypothetical protein